MTGVRLLGNLLTNTPLCFDDSEKNFRLSEIREIGGNL